MFEWAEMRKERVFILFVSIVLVAFFVGPHITHAQSFLNENTGVQLSTNPSNPKPYMDVEVSLNDYSVVSAGATILWYLDGIEQKELQNERSIIIKTKGIGERTTVRVSLVRRNAPTLSHTLVIMPAVIDIIIEANTYVPHFFKGRPLPSSESQIRMIAVVHDGSSAADTSYTYTWSENGTVLFGGPIKGKNVALTTLSRYGTREFSVEVSDASGKFIGREWITARAVQPELHFYEESPLRGLGEKALGNPYVLTGGEATLYGEPYFIHTPTNTESVNFAWKINGEPTASDFGSPNAVTIRQLGGSGEAQISLRVLTTRQIPQLIDRAFQILF